MSSTGNTWNLVAEVYGKLYICNSHIHFPSRSLNIYIIPFYIYMLVLYWCNISLYTNNLSHYHIQSVNHFFNSISIPTKGNTYLAPTVRVKSRYDNCSLWVNHKHISFQHQCISSRFNLNIYLFCFYLNREILTIKHDNLHVI